MWGFLFFIFFIKFERIFNLKLMLLKFILATFWFISENIYIRKSKKFIIILIYRLKFEQCFPFFYKGTEFFSETLKTCIFGRISDMIDQTRLVKEPINSHYLRFKGKCKIAFGKFQQQYPRFPILFAFISNYLLVLSTRFVSFRRILNIFKN